MKHTPISALKRTSFCRDAAAGMWHLHKQGVVHRDLAARNLLIDHDLCVKVADFGLSRIKDQSNARVTKSVANIFWMSPESIRNREYHEPSDVYSFGHVMLKPFAVLR